MLMHCGPFANIAHGSNSLVADRMGLKLGDYVVTEAGFASDMGMEKFFDIVCRVGGPQAERGRARRHGARAQASRRVDATHSTEHGIAAIEAGVANLRRHLEIVRAVRRAVRGRASTVARATRDEELERSSSSSRSSRRVRCRDQRGLRRGGAGASALAEAVVEACEQPSDFTELLYRATDSIAAKIEAVATRIYGADGRRLLHPAAQARIR